MEGLAAELVDPHGLIGCLAPERKFLRNRVDHFFRAKEAQTPVTATHNQLRNRQVDDSYTVGAMPLRE